jgi:diaminopimelate epimerase
LKLNEENNIQISILGSYSKEAEIVLERRSTQDFDSISYTTLSQSVLVDAAFDKETDHNFTYRIQIRKNGNSSMYSNEESIDYKASELNSPNNFHLESLEGDGIKLSWLNASKHNDGFIVQKKVNSEEYSDLVELKSADKTYLDTITGGFDPSLELAYRIKAFNSKISSKWIEKGTEFSGINKPTNFKLSGVKPNGFELIWKDNSNVETGYSLERKKDDGNFEEISLLESNTTYYLDNLSETGSFTYRIRAIKDEYFSPYSDEIVINSSVQEVTYGEVISEAISVEGEVDIYKFIAETNDVVLIQGISGTIHTRFVVYDPEGNLIWEGGNGGWLRYRSQKITKDGIYTLFVLDYGNNNTGSYDLTLDRVNNPADPQEIAFGEIVTDRIDNSIEMESYTFDVEVDDIILIQSISGEINTRYELYNSEGTLLYEGGNGGWLRYRSPQKITRAEQFTLFVMDYGGNHTGSYNFTLDRVNNPADPQEIAFGEIVTDRIDNSIEMESYTFDVEVDDIILIQSISGEINTRYELYNSEGTMLYEGGNGGWLRYRSPQKITRAEQFTLFVMDYGGNHTGSYNFTLDRVNNPADPQEIAFGEIVTDRIDNSIEMESYTFDVEVDDIILIQSISGEINTRYELYNSEGTMLYEGGNGGWLRYRSPQKITRAEQFTLFVMDYGGNHTGSYNFTLDRVNNPANPQKIAFGEIITDRIDNSIEMESYTFDVEVDDIILIQSISGEINTRYELYNSEGTMLYEGGNGGWLRYRSPQKITRAEQFTLFVMDYGGNHTGSYNFTLDRVNNPANPQKIAFGEIITDRIDNSIEMESYTFDVEVDDIILIQSISGEINTRYELYNSEGTLLYEGGNGGWLRYRSPQKITRAEQFTLFVMDYGGNHTGSYNFTLDRVNNPADPQEIAFGEIVTDRIDNSIEMESYTFDVEVDDIILIQSISGEINTRYELYNSEGTLLYEGGNGGWLRYRSPQKITRAEQFTLFVMDYGGNNIGSYDLTIQGLVNPANAGSISKNDSLVNTTTNRIEIKTYKLHVESTDKITITMGRTGGSINPRIEVYDPKGALIYEGSASTTLKTGELQLNSSGDYTILSMDQNADGTGSFYVKIE